MSKPLVSILIPVYNVEAYLERCLDSLIKQTMSEIEIICVNDGSTDNSLEILERYRKLDSRIIIINKQNGGLPSARNAGLDAAQGKYVGFVDSDDYVDINMFKKLYETAEQEKSEVVICGAHIFPENPRANDWLYACLSPWYQHYDEFDPKVLFECVCTTPFLWRTFIKRDLLERNHLRLDESVLIGEDKSFQAKVYPRAKGITVIPDKLYYYCWYREGSMMNQDVYIMSDKKIKAHCKLVECIGEDLVFNKATDDTLYEYLKWSIPFLYADFIALPLNTKISLADNMISIWEKCRYYTYKWKLPDWINEQFEYFYSIREEKIKEVDVSIIVPVSDRTEYIECALDSILAQKSSTECILVNNGASNETYNVLHRYLFKDKRVRLYNMDKKSYADALNNGIGLAVGKYVTFCETDGWYNSQESVQGWYDVAVEEGADICASIPLIKASNAFENEYMYTLDKKNLNDRVYIDNDFHHFLYKNEFLKGEKAIRFGNGSILTGLPFVAKVCSKTQKKSYYEQVVYVRRNLHRADWISTQKCETVLEELNELMKYAYEMKNADIQAKVLSVLNDDYMKRIIINNTRAYHMPPHTNPNGENSQVATFKYVYSILSMVDAQLLQEAGYDVGVTYGSLMYELVKERQKYLADMSERYIKS